jgi:hypothetical protein
VLTGNPAGVAGRQPLWPGGSDGVGG